MICAKVVPCLSSSLARHSTVMSMFVLFSLLFYHFESLACFSFRNLRNKPYFFNKKAKFCWKKLWPFGPSSEDIGDYIDVCMIKIIIKTNQIDLDVCFFQK